MSQFLYYVPGVAEARDLNPARLASIGLGHVADGEGVRGVATKLGPDQASGFVFFAGAAERLFPRYAPAEQTWTIPIARSLVRGDSLPKRPMLGADGKTWSLTELPEFAALCEQAERVGAVIYGAADGGRREMTWLDAMESAAMALGTNYRLSAVEIDVLGLFDTTTRVMDICRALVDLPAFERMMAERDAAAAAADPEQKKSDPACAGSSSSAGGGGC